MAAPFYSQTDQDIYASGNRFIPQEQYRLNYTPPSIMGQNTNLGITNTQAASPYIWPPQGGGGGGNIAEGPNISDFQTTVEGRQKRLQDPNKISQLLGKFIPQQRSAQDILASGVKDTRMLRGIPLGIGAMIGRSLPDKYYQMPVGDQSFIQSQMGYSDPNTQQGNQDPFGVNVRSAFGNYADFVVDEADKLEGIVADQKRRGLTNTLQMKKLRYYRPLRAQRKNIQSDAALIEKASPIAQVRQNIQTYGGGDRPNTGLNEPGGGKGQSPTGGDVAGTPFAEGGRIGYERGRVVNPGGYSGEKDWLSSKGYDDMMIGMSGDEIIKLFDSVRGTWSKAQGGRIGYAYGDPVIPEDETEDIFELMRDQNIPISEQVEGDAFQMRIQELMGKGLSYDDAYDIAEMEFQDLFAEGSEQDQGLASLV